MLKKINSRILKEKIFKYLFTSITLFCCLIIFILILSLFIKSKDIIIQKNIFKLIFSKNWHPLKGEFGLLPFIISTLYVTIIAVIIALPMCILTSFYLAEFANKIIGNFINIIINILAGIPSIIYGIWGVLIIVPLIKNISSSVFGISVSGYSILSGGIVLSIMIYPIITQISVEIFKSVPHELKEVSIALGATKWETTKYVVFKKSLPGIVAAVILGIARALGETIAVLMVVGNVVQIPFSLLHAGYPLTSLIANNYGEMLSVPLYDSAIMFAAFILLLIILAFNLISVFVLKKIKENT